MRALLSFLVLAVAVRPICAQRPLSVGDTVQIAYRAGQYYVAGRGATRLHEGLLSQLTPDSVVVDGTAGARAVARRDVVSVRRLSGHGYDWHKATVPIVAGGALGLILGISAVSQDDGISGAEAALGVTAFTLAGLVPGFREGLDSRGRQGFTIGALVGAAAGFAVGIATKPDPGPPCNPATQICLDLPSLEDFYIVGAVAGGVWVGGLIGGVVGSMKPGNRWEKLRLPATSLGVRPLPGGRAGLVIATPF